MSTETILSRMMSEPAFADAVFANAEKALAGYNLPADDLAKFAKLTRARFDAMTPEERKSFASLLPDTDPGGGTGSNHNQSALSIRQ